VAVPPLSMVDGGTATIDNGDTAMNDNGGSAIIVVGAVTVVELVLLQSSLFLP